MAMQADTTDNKSRMRVTMTVFQGRQSDVPCNEYVSGRLTGSVWCLLLALQAGVLSELRGSLLVGAQYLLDCHVAPGQFVAQVMMPRAAVVHSASSHSMDLPPHTLGGGGVCMAHTCCETPSRAAWQGAATLQRSHNCSHTFVGHMLHLRTLHMHALHDVSKCKHSLQAPLASLRDITNG
jgi:hypothetical protein